MPFSYKCDFCGEAVVRAGRQTGAHIFCGQACYSEWQRVENAARVCPMCTTEFMPRTYKSDGSPPKNPNRKFCSQECYDRFRGNAVTKTCVGCDGEFTVKACVSHRYNFCSIACKRSKIRFNKCEACGKIFRGEQTRYESSHCSEVCRRPPVHVDCEECGVTFRVTPGMKEGGRRFCRLACYRKFVGETGLERKVRLALESAGVNYEKEVPLGRFSIDFTLPDIMVAIEADGSYWHSLGRDTDDRKDAAMRSAGWVVVRLGEDDVNDAQSSGLLWDLIRWRIAQESGARKQRQPPCAGIAGMSLSA